MKIFGIKMDLRKTLGVYDQERAFRAKYGDFAGLLLKDFKQEDIETAITALLPLPIANLLALKNAIDEATKRQAIKAG